MKRKRKSEAGGEGGREGGGKEFGSCKCRFLLQKSHICDLSRSLLKEKTLQGFSSVGFKGDNVSQGEKFPHFPFVQRFESFLQI